MNITNGTVEYERVVRPADYESKRAKVSLTFAVEEDGSDPAAVANTVMRMAMAEVHRTLGVKGAAPVPLDKEKRLVEDSGEKPYHGRTPPPEITVTATVVDPAAIPDPDEDETPPATVEYTDKDLHTAVQQAVAEHGVTASEIRALTTEFTGVPGKSLTLIGKEPHKDGGMRSRADYIARIKALHKT